MDYSRLEFRRQFLLTTKPCPELRSWKHESVDNYELYVHPDLDHLIVRRKEDQTVIILIGYIIDPYRPQAGNEEIVHDLSKQKISVDNVIDFLHTKTGRFVLGVKQENRLLVFHDPCGLRTVYYKKEDEEVHIASQPTLFGLVTSLHKGKKFEEYHSSQYVSDNTEHWIPSGISLCDDVYQLIPNHYLESQESRQVRYWPNGEIEVGNLEDSAQKVAFLLRGTMIAANNRFRLALPLTAGWDSRTVLSACQEIAREMYFYTLQYRSLTRKSPDLRIPQKLLSFLGYQHHIIKCKVAFDDVKFRRIYEKNSDLAHYNDWGIIAHNLCDVYPGDRVCIKGCCAEIGRCYYRPHGKHEETTHAHQLLDLEKGWKDLGFIKRSIEDWFDETHDLAASFKYNIFDLFYWEHRMGSWQSQSQLEWDISMEEFAPFNNRELLDTMLGVGEENRCSPDYLLFKKVMQKLWPEVLAEPINPSVKNMLKQILKKIGILNGFLHLKSRSRVTR